MKQLEGDKFWEFCKGLPQHIISFLINCAFISQKKYMHELPTNFDGFETRNVGT